MPKFFNDIMPFLGTQEKNELGQDLESFLEEYDPKKYENPCVTVDTLVIRHKENISTGIKELKLLMIKRKNHPCIGFWALPGGFVDIKEDTMEAAKRELREETGLSNIPIEQIYTWGEANRDPRTRIITVAYLALVKENLAVKAGDDAADAAWMDVDFKLTNMDKSNNRIMETYELNLYNDEKKIELTANIEVSKNDKGLLKEKYYKVITSNGIAFDHARFIIHALLYIEDSLKENI